MGVTLDVVIGTEVNRDNVAAHTSAIRRHPTEITTSHHKSGSSDRSFMLGTPLPRSEQGIEGTLKAGLRPSFAMTVSSWNTRHSVPSTLSALASPLLLFRDARNDRSVVASVSQRGCRVRALSKSGT
jgi:hypothetical protein